MPFKYPSMIERLLANSVVLPTDDPDYCQYNGDPCWVWIGRRACKGYGLVNIRRDGKTVPQKAHRMSLIYFKGRHMPPRTIGRHLCNNPPCINPNHLVGGTVTSNNRQTVRDGRHRNQYGRTGT